MERVIKFRVWLTKVKKMTYCHSIRDMLTEQWDFTEDDIFLQFTGLKDKNGKEIYEGDVIEWTNGEIRQGGMVSGKWVPNAERITVTIEEKGLHCSISHLVHVEDTIEIIGNIHENPELIAAE